MKTVYSDLAWAKPNHVYSHLQYAPVAEVCQQTLLLLYNKSKQTKDVQQIMGANSASTLLTFN